MKTPLFYIFLFISLVFASCIEKPVYPTKPVIKYVDFLKYGNPANPDSVELVVSFTDNEGDIGLEPGDTFGIFKDGNIWLEYYYDSANLGTTWAAFDNSLGTAPFDTFKIFYRVPPVLPDGDPSEPMKGLIYVKQSPYLKIHDRIKYVVYLYDRALNRSDTIHTPPISFQ